MPSRRYKRKRTSRRRSQRRSRRSQRRSRRSSRKLRRYRSSDLRAGDPPLSTDDDSSSSSPGSGLGIPCLKDHAEKSREMQALYEKEITYFTLNHETTPIPFHGQYKENGIDDSFLYVKGTVTPRSFNEDTINVHVSIEEFYMVRHGFFNEQFQEVDPSHGQGFIIPISHTVPLDKIVFDETFACPLYGEIDKTVVAFVNDRFTTLGRTFVQTNVFLQS